MNEAAIAEQEIAAIEEFAAKRETLLAGDP